jgi:hypothetical protein
MRRRVLPRQTFLLLAITASLQVACARGTGYPGLTPIGLDWVERLCEGIARDCLQIDEINRSSDGRELRVVFRQETVVVAPTEVRAYKKPGLVAWMNDEREWVAWSDDLKPGAFYLQSASSRIHATGYPKFDSGGRFFAVTEGKKTHLYRVAPYRQEATIPLDLVSSVFSRPPLVFVVGPDRNKRRLFVYTYRDTGQGADFVASRVIERPNAGASSSFYFSDVTANGELFTIHDGSDPVSASQPTVLVYESTSGRLKPIRTGSLPWATLFLSEELRNRMNSKTRFTLAPTTSAGVQD